MADYVSPGTRRSAMGDTYLKQQALATPGAVAGDGGYVYRPDDAGSAITVLYDPGQAATGVTLTEGPEFEAIRSELVRRGVMSPAEPPVGVSAGEAEKMRSDAIAMEQGQVESIPGVSAGEAEKMRSDAIAMEQDRVESPRDPASPEQTARADQAAQAQFRETRAAQTADGPTSEHPAVTEQRELQERLAAGELDMTPAPGGDYSPWAQKEEAAPRSISDRLAGIERALALITGQQEN